MYRGADSFRLLLSVEPLFMDEESEGKHVQEIKKKFLLLKNPIRVRVPHYTEPTLLGIFICNDNRKEGRCAGKKVIDIGEVLKNHAPGQNESHLWRPDDKVLFFSAPARL